MTAPLDAVPLEAAADRLAEGARRSGRVSLPAPGGVSPRAGRWGRRLGSAGRLAGLHGIVLIAVLTASAFALSRTAAVGIKGIGVRQLGAELRSFQQVATNHAVGASLLDFSATYLRSHAVPDRDLLEVGVPGTGAVSNAGGSAIASTPAISALLRTIPSRTSVSARHVAGRNVEVMAAPIWQSGRPAGVFVATVDLTTLEPASAAALHLALVEGSIALVAGVASAYLLLRRLLRRVGRITRTAERIGRGRLADRLGDQGSADEVGQLAHSFDSMLDRIESSVSAQHELLSDVSHQLRTPLTVARGHLEVLDRTDAADPGAVRETIGVAIAELDRMDGIIERLLVLGRAREPLGYEVHPVDLRSFLGDISRACQVLAERTWVLHPVPDLVACFEETGVRGAVLNLVDNAVRATGNGDVIALSASASDRELRLTVEDSGPGIPEHQRRAVLDRFARPVSRPGGGSGLGLAIVSAICQAHDGRVEVTSSEWGGAMVTMVIGLQADGGVETN